MNNYSNSAWSMDEIIAALRVFLDKYKNSNYGMSRIGLVYSDFFRAEDALAALQSAQPSTTAIAQPVSVPFNRTEQFELSHDGTIVTDHKTGLMWEQGLETEVANLEEGLEYAKNLRLGGYNDWFVTTEVNDLNSLVDPSRREPAINPIFKSRGRLVYTNHSVTGASSLVWFVNFYNGNVHYYNRASTGIVRACRRVSPKREGE